jgi:hypothetical protein
MTGLRKSFLFMIIHLTIVFNLERFDISGKNVIDVQWFVYMMILLVVVLTLTVKPLQSIPPYLAAGVWSMIYGLLHVFLFNERPVLGGIYTYLTVTELSLLTITVFLAYDLAREIAEVDEVIEKITLPMLGQRVLRLREASEEIKTEFIRSRRHSRPLSVMVVEMDPNTPKASMERVVREIQKTMVIRYLNSSLAQLLTREARRTDLIMDPEDENGFILLCPETNSDGSEVLAARLEESVREELGVNIKCGYASFPDQALTFEDLLQKAQFHLSAPEKLALYRYAEEAKLQQGQSPSARDEAK